MADNTATASHHHYAARIVEYHVVRRVKDCYGRTAGRLYQCAVLVKEGVASANLELGSSEVVWVRTSDSRNRIPGRLLHAWSFCDFAPAVLYAWTHEGISILRTSCGKSSAVGLPPQMI